MFSAGCPTQSLHTRQIGRFESLKSWRCQCTKAATTNVKDDTLDICGSNDRFRVWPEVFDGATVTHASLGCQASKLRWRFHPHAIELAVIEESLRDPYRVLPRPTLPQGSESRNCPHCQTTSVFKPFELFYRADSLPGF
jgi:hypothetical protein